MQTAQLRRILDLVTLLQSGHGANVEFLAGSLACSERTVFRDIKMLKDCGIDVVFDEDEGRYALDASATVSIPGMTENELLAILLAASISSISRSSLFGGEVNQAIAKLISSASDSVQNRYNRLVRAVVNENEVNTMGPKQEKTLRSILDAIEQRKRVHLIFDVGEGSTKTIVSPYRTVYRNNRWYVDGRSSSHDGQASIPMKAISIVEMLPETYHVPVQYLQAGHTGGA